MWQYNHVNELSHHGIKGMKWGVRRTPEQLAKANKKRKAKQKNDLSHPMAAETVKLAKSTVVTGVSALGTALIGSAATYAFAKKGKPQVASMVYSMSKKRFNEAVFATTIMAGATIVSGMMTSQDSLKSYLDEDRRIRKS